MSFFRLAHRTKSTDNYVSWQPTCAGAYSYTLVNLEADIREGQYMACISGVDVVYSVC